ncbi:glycosyltransferase family 2 protein [Yersinia kristensenii]|uniref:glycosyltransferase family 2 protein n=1 Tax=Yersinia kristensenii TaxID=28152 RepID=UPI0011A78722|nr:glycosyltransferase [Yersinia kristensenii]
MEILLSTCNERILNIKNLLESIDFDFCELLIGHQYSANLTEECKDFIARLALNDKIKYFSLSSHGVTKNRNFLIKQATSDYIVFCDDDIIYKDSALKEMVEIMKRDNIDVASGMTLTSENQKIKNYSSIRIVHSKLTILKVGTVEIVVRRGALNDQIFFPEDMGAGEKFPICDEPVFLSRCLDCGLKMSFIPIELCFHPPVSSGMLISSLYTQSRGLCIRRVFGLKGVILLIPFALKMKLRNKKIIIMRFIFDLFKGFYAK